jgi:cytochrome c-type biogenesis protein CcmH/NrfG
MDLISELESGRTLAELYGLTAEMGRAIADLAAREVEGGRLDTAHLLLEGLVLANPHDAATWCLLALVERRRGRLLAARLCAETARRLAPQDPQVRLVRAEVLLATAGERAEGRLEVEALAAEAGHVGDRARALRAALGAG